MGNSKSQINHQPKKQMYIIQIISRTWNRLKKQRQHNQTYNDDDRDTEISSKCSECKGCTYQQDSLFFDRYLNFIMVCRQFYLSVIALTFLLRINNNHLLF